MPKRRGKRSANKTAVVAEMKAEYRDTQAQFPRSVPQSPTIDWKFRWVCQANLTQALLVTSGRIRAWLSTINSNTQFSSCIGSFRIRRVEAWSAQYALGSTSAIISAMSTVGIEMEGNLGKNIVKADIGTSTRPAHVRMRPSRDSSAYQWRGPFADQGEVMFMIFGSNLGDGTSSARGPAAGTVIEVDLSMRLWNPNDAAPPTFSLANSQAVGSFILRDIANNNLSSSLTYTVGDYPQL